MKFIKSKKGIAIIAALVVLASSAVGAYAYFTSTGTGAGNATVGHPADWDVNVKKKITGGPLTPGYNSETINYTVTNAGSGAQGLNQVTIQIANSDGSPWIAVPGCSAADFTIDNAAAGGTATDTTSSDLVTTLPNDYVPSGVFNGTITIRMIDSHTNQDGCQMASPPLYLVAS